ncbi:MAG: PIG-L family deacetylase [Alphaproteobacteria bacterium]|nr:PIG-L family deacetylase [Alphaproteobacteria bacterium]
MFGKRILVLVPHPDDEIVACAAAIDRARAEGAAVFALYLTHGCLAQPTLWPWQRKHYDAYAARRRAEAEEAARFLGLAPVGWSPRPARHLWRELPEAHSEVQSAITRHAIDQLWVPAYEGGNADHDAANALGQIFKTKLSVLEFAEYNFLGGRGNMNSFPYPNGTEQTLTLTPEEQKKKRAALALYKSEKLNLSYVKTERECYRPLAAYDYSQPPHPGTLWYTRFQWVPFRHPRVDFTQSAEVSAAIVKFLNNFKG